MPIQAEINQEGIDNIHNQAQVLIAGELQQAQDEYELIKYDYDVWLDTLVSDQYVSDDSQTTTLSSSLYTINTEVSKGIMDSDIVSDYLEGNRMMLDSFDAALSQSSPESLGISSSRYYEMQEYINATTNQVDYSLSQHKLAYEAPSDNE